MDRGRRRTGGNGRAGSDVFGRQGPARRPADGRRGARQSIRLLLAGVRLRLPQPSGPGSAPGRGSDVAGGARSETRRRYQSARTRGQLRLGPDPGRRHVGPLRLFRRGRRPHDRPGEVPVCPPGQMVLGIPHPGDQRGRLPPGPPMGRVGRTTRGGHAQDEVAAGLRVHRTGRFRGSDRRFGARRQPWPTADPGARPRRGSVHRHLQQTRQRQDSQGERQPCRDRARPSSAVPSKSANR